MITTPNILNQLSQIKYYVLIHYLSQFEMTLCLWIIHPTSDFVKDLKLLALKYNGGKFKV